MTGPSSVLQPGPEAAWFAEDETVGTLDFGLAVTFGDFDAAFRLLHDRYVWRGYLTPEPSGRRLGLHNALPGTKLLVAKAEDRVVGTLTVVEDSCLGLAMDEAFGEELGRLRERGRRLAEASSLAVDRGYRASGIAILVRLLRRRCSMRPGSPASTTSASSSIPGIASSTRGSSRSAGSASQDPTAGPTGDPRSACVSISRSSARCSGSSDLASRRGPTQASCAGPRPTSR